jgi:hypothetical protein
VGTFVVPPSVSVNTTTATMTVQFTTDKPLFCEVLSDVGDVIDSGSAKQTDSNGSPTYYPYDYTYDAVPVGTGTILIQCGGDKAAPTTYKLTTTR